MDIMLYLLLFCAIIYAVYRAIAAIGGLLGSLYVIFFRNCSLEGFKGGFVHGDEVSRRLILDTVLIIFATIVFFGAFE